MNHQFDGVHWSFIGFALFTLMSDNVDTNLMKSDAMLLTCLTTRAADNNNDVISFANTIFFKNTWTHGRADRIVIAVPLGNS